MKTRYCSALLKITVNVATLFTLATPAAFGESMMLHRTAPQNQGQSASSSSDAISKVRLAVDDVGNVKVSCGEVTLTLIYGNSSTPLENRFQPGLDEPWQEEVALLGGLSLRLDMRF